MVVSMSFLKTSLGLLRFLSAKSFRSLGVGGIVTLYNFLSADCGVGIYSSKKSSRSSLPLVGRLPVLSLYHTPAAGSMAQAISSHE